MFKKIFIGLMFVMCLSVINAYNAEICLPSGCLGVEIPEVSLKLIDNDLILEFPTGILVAEGTTIFTGAVPFSFSYSWETGVIEMSINGETLSYVGIPQRSYSEISLMMIANTDAMSLTEMVLNSESVRDELINSDGGSRGVIIRDLNSQHDGFEISGVVTRTTATQDLVVEFGESILLEMPPTAILESGTLITHTEDVIDYAISSTIGAISVKVSEVETREILGLGQILWTQSTTNFVPDFELIVTESNGDFDISDFSYNDVFEISEEVTIGSVTASWITNNVIDGNSVVGWSVMSNAEESLALIPCPENSLGVDIWIIY